jgi:hypothetical protein
MRGEYSGWNGTRDFLGEGGEGKGDGIAWDSPQPPLTPRIQNRSLMIYNLATWRLRPHRPEDGPCSNWQRRFNSVFLPHFQGHDPAPQSLNPGDKVSLALS